MLSVLGLSMVGALSGRSLLKGIVAGGFGLLLSAVGTESQVGIIRYAGENLYLLDGLPLIPIAVGLLGLPELIRSSLQANRHRASGPRHRCHSNAGRTRHVYPLVACGAV